LPGCCDAVGSVGNGNVELAGRQGLEKANAGAGVGLAAVADGDGEVHMPEVALAPVPRSSSWNPSTEMSRSTGEVVAADSGSNPAIELNGSAIVSAERSRRCVHRRPGA
jgi:hypothetical protein